MRKSIPHLFPLHGWGKVIVLASAHGNLITVRRYSRTLRGPICQKVTSPRTGRRGPAAVFLKRAVSDRAAAAGAQTGPTAVALGGIACPVFLARRAGSGGDVTAARPQAITRPYPRPARARAREGSCRFWDEHRLGYDPYEYTPYTLADRRDSAATPGAAAVVAD
ncbi:hypothetical protein EVAR_50233_1 [Eumeta japonica]|uniref:Uncharacterized protein n=1 Tax=Eumeta variegata TaxID=151549 RepID=A0A4C2A3E2_EUMVA|nr:hypothetical protein EVAR_50233_1 [Eumeta japonica]